MISNQELETLKRSSSILSIFQSKVSLKRDGKEWVGRCPLHSEKTASFRVSLYQWIYVFKCFGCGESGDIFKLIQKMEGATFGRAVDIVKETLEGSWEKQKTKVEKHFRPFNGQEEPTISYSLDQWKKFQEALKQSPEGLEWLKNRGIGSKAICAIRIGFRRDIGNLAGQDNLDISNKGWIAWPSIENSKVVAIKYRSIVRKAHAKQSGMAKGESTPLCNSDTIESLEPVYVVEGEPDMAIMEQAGFRSVSVQSASTPITARNKDRLLESDYIILAGDNDVPGNEFMDKLWSELQQKTYKLVWPSPFKDANQVFLEKCNGNIKEFKELVEELTLCAKSIPMKGITSLQESMLVANRIGLEDHPNRLRFPWDSVDKMANLLPGTVLYVFASSTGTGKTTFLSNVLVHNAKKGEVVINYSCELQPDEYANLVAAHILNKNRNSLTKADYQKAASSLGDCRFYIGRDPNLTKADEILDLIEAAVRRLGGTVVCLDHLHYAVRNESDTIKAQENAMQRIKNMAIKYHLKWINVGQPRKANQQSNGKRVYLTDSKGSETVFSDADAVFALHRDLAEKTNPDDPPEEPFKKIMEVHMMKGRSQGTGKAFTQLMFQGSTCSIYEVSKQEAPPESMFTEDMI